MPSVGPLRSAGVTPPLRYYRPIRQALAFRRASPPRLARVPCFRGLSPRGEEPFPVSDPWPCARATALYSAGRVFRRPISEHPAAFTVSATARRPGFTISRSLNRAFTHRCGPRTRSPRRTGLRRWASPEGISPFSATQAMRLRPLTASGLSPYGPMGSSRHHAEVIVVDQRSPGAGTAAG